METLLEDPATSPALRAQFVRVAKVRDFADSLGLAVGGRYTSYVDWPGNALVTAVVATRPGSVEPVTSWFPIVGHVPYRGYFDPAKARAYADSLRVEQLDVCLVEVPAYSTLGWFDDPLTGPLLRQEPALVVETLLHELLHATVFVPGDAEFNEGVAAFFGQEARVRFYADREGADAGARERRVVALQRRLRGELLALRREVEALYDALPPGAERDARRAALEAEARARMVALAPSGGDPATWMDRVRTNDACLALSGTYHADTPALEVVLAALGGDLGAFLAAVERSAASPHPRAHLLGLPAPDPP